MKKGLPPESLSTEMQRKDSSLIPSTVKNPRIPTDIANFIALDDLMVLQAITVERMDKLTRLEESKIPIGAPTFEWIITTTTKRVDLANPWISFSLHNDGPGNVKVRINTLEGNMSDETTVDSGEVLNRDFDYPIITRLYLVTESSTATVRVHAEEGRKWE